ncbi:hypothetical protein O9X98_15615 [Agrobacterium salinitolerans]|nr:hypothetical protein [Agrobacterium salinitolerans]
MCDLDRTLHPDIHAIEDVDVLIGHIVASCGCLTKTPEPRYHAADCRYKHLAHRLEELMPPIRQS